MAEVLGLSVAEFESALEDGRIPGDLAKEQGVEFAKIQAARVDALNHLVADGSITQEQAGSDQAIVGKYIRRGEY